ncbi:MAG: hypothetical protein EOP04_05075 [Proteobacteria bacterium]|nr:MAG: hypothetical protein EOP04_05075 [Pseudomonadota bacterium]
MGSAESRLLAIGGQNVFKIAKVKSGGPVCYPYFPLCHGKGGEAGERKVFENLRDGLGSEWIVFHSFTDKPGVSQVRTWRSDIDFVLAHRLKGIFIVEVKDIPLQERGDGFFAQYDKGPVNVLEKLGKAMEYLRRHVDESIGAGNSVKVKKAFLIALRNRQCRSWNGEVDIKMLPGVDLESLPTVLNAEPDSYPVRDTDWKRLENHFRDLANNLYKLSAQSVLIASNNMNNGFDDYLEELDSKLDLLQAEQKILVKGYAGTGKTQLLIHNVAGFSSVPDRYILVLCFNDLLVDALKESMQYLPNTSVHSFHGLCIYLATLVNPQFNVDDYEDRSELFGAILPRLGREALETGEFVPVDAIYIDEAQDFETSWLETISLFGDSKTKWFCNFDRSQQWQKEMGRAAAHVSDDSPFWEDFKTIQLYNNLRNPQDVRTGALVHLQKLEPEPNPKFLLHPYAQASKGVRTTRKATRENVGSLITTLLEELVGQDGLTAEQVVVLLDCGIDRIREGRAVLRFGQVMGEWKLGEEADTETIVLETIRRFKGLEAEVVIAVFEMDDRESVAFHRLGYLAATRARGGYYEVILS